MISKDLKKRFITSVPLILLLGLSFYYSPILIVSLIILSFISWIEFNGLISKIFKKKNFEIRVYKIFINFISLIYLIIFSSVIFLEITHENLKLNILFLFCVCICSDVGGLLFGKVFKGKKLTKISPNKTISGSIGSFVLSIVLVPVFVLVTNDNNFINIYNLILVSIFVSLVCQIGDLFISFLKRKAKVKDSGNFFPGHGGVLDRLDGVFLGIPIGFIFMIYLN